MVIVSDHRLIPLLHRPGFIYIDEYTYEIIAGVSTSRAGQFTAVTIDTRIKDITARFVNPMRAENSCIILRCVESRSHTGNFDL